MTKVDNLLIKVENLSIKIENLSIQFKINWFYDWFDGPFIIEISEGDNLGDNNNLSMIFWGRLHRPRLTPRHFKGLFGG